MHCTKSHVTVMPVSMPEVRWAPQISLTHTLIRIAALIKDQAEI